MQPRAFHKYLIQQRLGHGGMAEVFLGLDPDLNRLVAIKVIQGGLGFDPDFVERFRREAKVIAALRHPHIIQIYAFDVADAQPFMVMEYLEGGTLKERLAAAREGLPPAEVARLLRPIAAALDHAHGQGVVHRDLKPTNILFNAGGDPVLADFGIAKLADASVQLTRSGGILGTPAYISPEQVAGRAVDHRADLYSLGVVVYQMVTGRVPFQAPTPTGVLMQHLNTPPPPPRLLRPGLPPALEPVLKRALAKDPAERFATAGELLLHVAEALGVAGLTASPPPAPPAPAAAPVPGAPVPGEATEVEPEAHTLAGAERSEGESAAAPEPPAPAARPAPATRAPVTRAPASHPPPATPPPAAQAPAAAGEATELNTEVERAQATAPKTAQRPARAPEAGRPAAAARPPVTTPPSNTPRPRPLAGKLPPALTTFVGRQAEIDTITRLLGGGECRLLTLYGPSGAGKSRLAIEAARGLTRPPAGPGAAPAVPAGRFPGGVIYVPLGGVAPGAVHFLAGAIAEAAGLGPAGSDDPAGRLLEHLRGKHLLLVLDQFEHLLEAAGLLDELLEAAPQVSLLVTSTQRLALRGEHTLEVSGLPFGRRVARGEPGMRQTRPNLRHFSPAEQLFLLEAQRADHNFTFTPDDQPWVRRICSLVAGLPLAIELAADWVRQLSCREIAQEIERNLDFLQSSLRNVPERHRSLRAVFESAWQRLDPPEQAALRRLGVFSAGFRRAAAREVAEAGLPVLTSLVDRSLLDGSPQGRYALHAVLRQYALEKLAGAGEEPRVRARFAAYYARFAEQQAAALKGGAQAQALADMAEELGNVRDAWEWAAANQQANVLDAMLEGVFRFYLLRGWYREGEAALRQALDGLAHASAEAQAQRALARLRLRLGELLNRLGRRDEAEALLEQSRHSLEALGEQAEVALAHTYLGNLAYRVGQLEPAREHYRAGLALFEALGDRWGMAALYNNLGNIAQDRHQPAEARRLFEASLDLSRALGDELGVAGCLVNLGSIAVQLGDFSTARRLLPEALAAFRTLGDQMGVGVALHTLGEAAFYLGDLPTAGSCHAEALDARQALEDPWGQAESHYGLAAVAAERGQWESAQQHAAEAHSRYQAAGNVQRAAVCRYAQAECASALGAPGPAAAYLAEALARQDDAADPAAANLAAPARLARLAAALDAQRDGPRAWRLARFLLRQPWCDVARRADLTRLHRKWVGRLPAAIRAQEIHPALAELLRRSVAI